MFREDENIRGRERRGTVQEEEEIAIEIEEVIEAIKRIKQGKAGGRDGITPEMIKNGGDRILKWIKEICPLAWRGKKIPDDWDE